jgi:hypothetical protein
MRAHQILQLRFPVLRYSISPLFSISTPRPKTLSRQNLVLIQCNNRVSQVQTTKSCLLWHDAFEGKAANEYGTVVVKPEGKRPHGVTDMGKRQSCAFACLSTTLRKDTASWTYGSMHSFRNSIGVSDQLHAPTTEIHRIRGWVNHGMGLIILEKRQHCCFCREANCVMRAIRKWISRQQ